MIVLDGLVLDLRLTNRSWYGALRRQYDQSSHCKPAILAVLLTFEPRHPQTEKFVVENMISRKSLQHIEELHAPIAKQLKTLISLAEDQIDPDLLRLTVACIDAGLLFKSREPGAHLLTGKEKAWAEFADQFVISVSAINDSHVEAISEGVTADEVYVLAHALYVIDMSRRLDMVLEKVLK